MATLSPKTRSLLTLHSSHKHGRSRQRPDSGIPDAAARSSSAETGKRQSGVNVHVKVKVKVNGNGNGNGNVNPLVLSPAKKDLLRCLMATQQEVFALVERNLLQPFLHQTVVAEDGELSKQIAVSWCRCWSRWQRPATGSFCSFPSPVNTVEFRLHAFVNVLLLAVAFALDWYWAAPWLFVYVAYGFVVRALCGPRLCPTAFFVLFALYPCVQRVKQRCCWRGCHTFLHDEFVPGAPRRFAQAIGAFVSLTALCLRIVAMTLQYHSNSDSSNSANTTSRHWLWASWSLWALLLLVVLTLALTDFCVGCWFFGWLMRTRCTRQCIPASVCEQCERKYVRFDRKDAERFRLKRAKTAPLRWTSGATVSQLMSL